MRNGLSQCHTLQRQFACGLPKRNGGFSTTCRRQMMRQHLGLGDLDAREALLDHPGDLGVQLLPTPLEQRVIRRVLHQRMLEGVDSIRRRAAAEGQSRLAQPCQRLVQLGLRIGATASIIS